MHCSIPTHMLYRESASCTHISALLHALVALRPGPPPTAAGDSEEDDEGLPVTSYPNQWKPPRKRKQSNLKFADVTFEKHTYGRERKHQWKMIKDFDPRPVEYRGSAPEKLKEFVKTVKGKGLGISVLFDEDFRCKSADTTPVASGQLSVPTRQELMEKVARFKELLCVTPDKIREIDRNTREQHKSPLWFSARRFRLTASVFGRILRLLPSTPPDSLVKTLLHPKQVSTPAMNWGKTNESTALSECTKYYRALGNTNIVVCKAGFVVCEEHPFLGASPDAYVHDPHAEDTYGLAEIKCPFKYRNICPNDAAKESDFCSKIVSTPEGRSVLELKHSHAYYAQVQGQMAITGRKWCDFVIYTTKGISIERIPYDAMFWNNELLPKLTVL